MKGVLIFTKILTLALIIAASSFAQTQSTQTVPTGKIVYVNSEAFYEKATGITELVEITEKIEAEFQTQADELNALAVKIQTLEKELKAYNENARLCLGREVIKLIEEKVNEYEFLIDKYKTKEAFAKYLYERRAAETIDVVKKKIARAANSFAKEKGYVLILDSSKSNGTFTFSNSGESDITADFIKYYNEIYTKLKTQ